MIMAMRNASVICATAVFVQAALVLAGPVPEPAAQAVSLNDPPREHGSSLPVYGCEVVNAFPHDSNAFTQGLVFKDGYIYEGTGRYGESTLRKIAFESGAIVKLHHLGDQYFGEGVTIYRDTIQQLTWTNGVGFMYVEGDTFECIDTFSYATQGWGLTHNDTCLIMSNGGPVIDYLDPATHQVVRQIRVTADGVDVDDLNELEYIQGRIYANVWYSDSIAVIDPANGRVACWINCHGILNGPPNVLNGIAFDPGGVRLFVTGKLWPALFEIATDPVNYPPSITDFSPASPCLIAIDSTLFFNIDATDPDGQDSLSYSWKVNGLTDTSAHGSGYFYRSAKPAIDTITAMARDLMYQDSVIWIVHVLSTGHEQRAAVCPGFDIFIPNPCRPDVSVKYTLAEPVRVTIEIYDAVGRKVGILVDGMQDCGAYSVPLTAAIVPSVCFFKVNIGGEILKYKRVFLE